MSRGVSQGSRELPTDHLASTTREGHRVYLYPADVQGKFRKFRHWLNGVLILIFLTLPWIRIGGRPAILLNLPERRFSILGVQFWAHDVPMVFFVIAAFVLTIVFITSVWGRVWCGYACPQTVFIDGVFRRIERWVEGDSVARKRLNEGPMTFIRFRLKALKWLLFALCSLIIGHSFLAYFAGTEALGRMMAHSPLENPGAFGVMAFVSGLVLFDFGWFREQFCIVACPYGRFQSVLMDDRSMVVGYDTQRGEPRKAGGDCINCYRCVAVCPTGVDIRRGASQMECIACTACMDACDRVMEKIGKPTGLIRYKSLMGDLSTVTPLRTRSMIYFLLLAGVLLALSYKLSTRKSLSVEFVRAVEAPYQVVPGPASGTDALVVNHFKVAIRNQAFERAFVSVRMSEQSRAQGVELVAVQPEVQLDAGELRRMDVFIRFPQALLKAGVGSAWIETASITQEVRLVGPF
ncbi:MAG: cytochrome c oxidase accessory protein CcoG [Oligoflexia bacterium]